MLFISIHKMEGRYWKYGREILGQKTEKMQLFIAHFMSCEELISTDQPLQMYFTVFGFCQTLIFYVTFQGNYFWKITFHRAKVFTSQDFFFLNSVTSGVISGIKCYQFSESDASLIILKYYTVRFFWRATYFSFAMLS